MMFRDAAQLYRETFEASQRAAVKRNLATLARYQADLLETGKVRDLIEQGSSVARAEKQAVFDAEVNQAKLTALAAAAEANAAEGAERALYAAARFETALLGRQRAIDRDEAASPA